MKGGVRKRGNTGTTPLIWELWMANVFVQSIRQQLKELTEKMARDAADIFDSFAQDI